MIQATLNIKSAGQEKQHTLPEGGSVTLGRTDASTIAFENDHGLSRRHATFSLNGGKVFVADEGSTNGTFLNGMRVSTGGASLASGNEVRIGNDTTIRVLITDAVAEPVVETAAQSVAPAQSQSTDSSLLKYLIPAILLVFVVLFVVGFILYKMSPNVESSTTGYQIDSSGNNSSDPQGTKASVEPSPAMTELPNTSPSTEPGKDVHIIESNPSTPPPIAADTPPPPAQRKLYKNMSEDEQKEFIKQRAQHIAIMMGKRPYAFTPEALVQIKFWLDAFTRRAGNNRTGLWGGDTIAILQRGRVQAPLIIHSFKEFGVPYVVGLYIPFIETEYNNISSNNAAGAAGLFQFLGPTAESYGVPAAERTNVAKMAPAAAKLRQALERVVVNSPRIPVIHNVDAKSHTAASAISSGVPRRLMGASDIKICSASIPPPALHCSVQTVSAAMNSPAYSTADKSQLPPESQLRLSHCWQARSAA